jgi:hypothetical protein
MTGQFRCVVCREFVPDILIEKFGSVYICRRHIRANDQNILNKVPLTPELISQLVMVISENIALKEQKQIAIDTKNTIDELQKTNASLQNEIIILKSQVGKLTKEREDLKFIINCNKCQINELSKKQDILPFIDPLTKKVSDLESIIKDKEDKDQAIQTEILGLINELRALKSDIAQNEKNTIVSLRENIDSTSNEIKQIFDAVQINALSESSKIKRYIEQYHETIHEMIKAELKAAIESLNQTLTNQINSLFANKINEIDTKIEGINITLNCCKELVESKIEQTTAETEESTEIVVHNSVEPAIKTQIPAEITNINHIAIYNYLKSTPSTAKELIDATGINRQSIYDALKVLKAEGIIIQDGYGGKYHIRE